MQEKQGWGDVQEGGPNRNYRSGEWGQKHQTSQRVSGYGRRGRLRTETASHPEFLFDDLDSTKPLFVLKHARTGMNV